MLGISKDIEILNNAITLYAENSTTQASMDAYELGQGLGPTTLKPMHVNWAKIDGKWNGRLLEMFFQHCREQHYSAEALSDIDLLEIRELFFNRLRRLATIINKYRPAKTEALEDFAKRVKNRHVSELARQRRTTRRNEVMGSFASLSSQLMIRQLKVVRTDTALANIPDWSVPIEELTQEEKMWLDTYRILREYGEAGVSSDETDGDEEGTYIVRKMEWINKKYAKRVAAKLDKARRTTNQYGNAHGHQPRKRKRPSRRDLVSARKPPMHLPLNLYNKNWYNSLPAAHKVLLQPKEAMVMYANWETDGSDAEDS
ncbi:hypothetical protein CVT26_007985 [Gymnopilus dilepis]|uniref:Uncharacterized protein n=1 Tax=Gymnopilus dilepis TaxID=231916 RepID=A0A409W7M9_9AGAR|nr:hypothetical protein CVT26_007985 [Gymnopilus dilepis]